MKRLMVFFAVLLMTSAAYSQKVKLKSGSMAAIKGEDVFEVRFTYENMKVGRITEAEYVTQKRQEANERDHDGGDRWHTAWVNDRANRFEPKFIELFNKYAKNPDLVIDRDRTESKYIMIVNTYFTEPGFNVGISSKKATVSMLVTFVERTAPDTPVAVFDAILAPGAEAFDMGFRIQEAYAKAGKSLAKVICKQLR
ncbi:MAG: hypothetical protein PHT69_11365 [Bacteroidales bacterium]|nr:hypothetical protein [Bacteroidales bacterium]